MRFRLGTFVEDCGYRNVQPCRKLYRGIMSCGDRPRLLHIFPDREQRLIPAMLSDELESDREFFAVTLYRAGRYRNSGHAREIYRNCEYVGGVHSQGIARLLPY